MGQVPYNKSGSLIERAMSDLNAMPLIAAKLVKETQSDHVSAKRIEKLLLSDPALAAKVLRTVNSAYYGLSRQVYSLDQAVIVLGIQQVRNLAIGVLAFTSMNCQDPKIASETRDVWAHSLETAIASQYVAESMGLGSTTVEHAFLVGLLHDIGRLFFITQFSGPYLALRKRRQADDDSIAVMFGISPKKAGAMLLNKWKLPAETISAVEQVGDQCDDRPLLRAVSAAHSILEELDKQLPKAAAHVGLDEAGVAGIRENVTFNTEKMRAVFGIVAA